MNWTPVFPSVRCTTRQRRRNSSMNSLGTRRKGEEGAIATLSFVALGVRLRLLGHRLLVAAGLDHLDDGAIRGAEAQRRGAGLGEDFAAMAPDDISEGFAVGDFESPVMDAGAGAGQ